MAWVNDFFVAVGKVGFPMMALSFAVIWWALHRGRVRGESVGELQKSLQALGARRKGKKAKKDKDGLETEPAQEPEKLDPVLDKWFAFGGGFYGLVALYTWLLIEWDEAWGFITGLGALVLSFDPGTLISLVVNFFIESLMNFVAAIAWPAYWIGAAGNPWVWVIVAYGGYWLGIQAAQWASGRRWRDDEEDLARSITGSDDDPG